ncbi:hypothetical protein Rhal01_01591 [Rubritalea halochordaticola]|uniref:Rhomboid family intramembrane serine protease n=1 Tax=Rubritalea halochordaticola TaxID=714537 RepID=A0ABP9UY92_9BACT
MQQQYYGNGNTMRQPSKFEGAQACKWLLIINIVVFFLDAGGVERGTIGRFKEFGGYTTDGFLAGQIWRVVSFQFLHFGGWHLLGNMLAVFFFGPFVERFWGTKKFVAYYLICGAAGALFYSILGVLGVVESYGLLCGASAGIFGIIVALIIIAPDMRVMLLFPPIPMKMRTLGIVFLVIAVYVVLTGGQNDGGEAGHLGGAIMGFVLMKFPGLLGFLDPKGARGAKRPKVVREAKIRPRTVVNLQGDEVDRILDKISEQGFQSLTDEEKQILSDAAKREDD